MQSYEKLGSFYLGKAYDAAAGRTSDDLLLYDAKDLVTHAICVGMTGSGKTGLCIGLLEEAAIDNIPALIIDPKGDLTNLLLTFPDLSPSDFRPWINESDAQQRGMTPDAFAADQAALWSKGLTQWQQDGQRIARLRAAADVLIYTPGSQAGVPLSIANSFACPPFEVLDDAELLRDRINTTVSSLLSLAGITSDPLRGREHILLATILQQAWASGENLDLPTLITRAQTPPFSRVGVLEVESFYPSKDRFELVMVLNNLLASPQFAAWMQGQPMDIASMLYTPQGKPRLAVVSIAHLGDRERMFIVSLLLNEMLAWTRRQSGTTSLRAILYMDEIAGYVPPIANPPSKQAIMTLMKQARAFGVGVVLATQNPADIDYKAIANAGTWFIGRLQTEQDKARLLDGLQSAMADASQAFDRAVIDRTLGSLGKRVFLMNNVHEPAPVVFETRWCMSYLRGPLTRGQIKQLMDPIKGAAPAPMALAPTAPTTTPTPTTTTTTTTTTPAARPTPPATPIAPAPSAPAPSGAAASAPILPPDVQQYFLPVRGSRPTGSTLVYEPTVLGFAKVHFDDRKLGVNTDQPMTTLCPFVDGPVPVDFEQTNQIALTDRDVERQPADGAGFATLPPAASKAKSYTDWSKRLADRLYRTATLELMYSEALDELSKPGESEREFRARLVQTARERRDEFVAKLRAKYGPKMATLQERLRRAQQQVDAQRAQASASKVNTALSIGAAVLGGLLGRKAVSAGNVGRTATAARSANRAMQEAGDVARAEETVEAVQAQIQALQQQTQDEIDAFIQHADPATEKFTPVVVRPKKADVKVHACVLGWVPHWHEPSGQRTPAWE